MNPCSAGNAVVSSQGELPVSLPVATAGPSSSTLWAPDAYLGAQFPPPIQWMANDGSNGQWPGQWLLTNWACGDAFVCSHPCQRLALLASFFFCCG